MLDLVRAIHEALGIQSTWGFVLCIALAGFLIFGGLAWIADKSYKKSLPKPENTSVGAVNQEGQTEIIRQLSDFAEEGNQLIRRNKERARGVEWHKAREWAERAETYIKQHVNDQQAAYFSLATTKPYPGLAVDRLFVDWVQTRIDRLGEIASDLRSGKVRPSPNKPPPESQTKTIAKPIFKVTAPTAFPGLIKLDVNVFRRLGATTEAGAPEGSVFPVIATFENIPQPEGFNETDTVWAHIIYQDHGFGDMELVRISSGCWLDEPLPDITFPFRKPRYLILGGWYAEGKKPTENSFRVFEQSRELHRAVESPIKMAAPRQLQVEVTMTPNGQHERSREYKFALVLESPGWYRLFQIGIPKGDES